MHTPPRTGCYCDACGQFVRDDGEAHSNYATRDCATCHNVLRHLVDLGEFEWAEVEVDFVGYLSLTAVKIIGPDTSNGGAATGDPFVGLSSGNKTKSNPV